MASCTAIDGCPSCDVETAERDKLLQEAQFLYKKAKDRLQAARDELSGLEIRLKVREQQQQFGTSAWMTLESEDGQ